MLGPSVRPTLSPSVGAHASVSACRWARTARWARPVWGREWSVGLREGMRCVSSVGDGVRGVGACVSGVCVALTMYTGDSTCLSCVAIHDLEAGLRVSLSHHMCGYFSVCV